VAAGEPATAAKGRVLVDRYEELRRQALGGGGHGWRLGLAVLHRQGMVAWIHAWDDIAPLSTVPPPASVPSTHCTQMVAVLASMALAVVEGG
jgi:hypothetical protein